MATSLEFTEEQLTAARVALWHQNGEALVTLEAAQEFLERFGLVAFAPGKLAMTAPSLVEATLGTPNGNPTAAAAQTARDLVARMAGDGSALPLNLLGGGGDTPDFVVSGSALKFVFTLRGDKNWKKAPETSGAAKVSPLSLRVYETLVEKGGMTAAELASELGREVTEAAIVRSLGELWQALRVIPLLGLGENPTLWELTSRRFTRAIKAGMNAGQPTALSALISLYLQQALVATEDEIETFLSPLAARSRVREVLHALRGARELSEVVVNGKTLLHVTGELPEIASAEEPEEVEGDEVAGSEAGEGEEASEGAAEGEGSSRIKKFAGEKKGYAERSPYAKKAADAERTAAKALEPRTREGGKVAFKRAGAAKPFGDKKPFGAKRTFGDKPAFGARKPFGAKPSFGSKPSFTKPWDEDKKPRRAAGAEGAGEAPTGAFAKYRKPAPAPGRATLRAEKFAGRPTWDGPGTPQKPREEASERGSFDRPKRAYAPREGGSFDRPKRPYTPRGEGQGFDGTKKPFRPRTESGTFDREKRPYTPRGEGRSFDGPKRPYTPRGEAGTFDRPKRPYVKREGGSFDGPKRPYTPREGSSFDRPKRPYTPREGGSFDGPKRPYTPRGEGKSFDGPKRPYTPREGAPFERPKRAYTPREGGSFDGPKRPYTPREGGEDRPKRPYTPREGGNDRKPFGARKPFGDRPKFGGDREGGNFRAKRASKPAGKSYGAGKLFDKKGPLPADGEGGLSPTGSKRKRNKEE